MTAVPVPSAPDRRAHEQQQLADFLMLWSPYPAGLAAALLAPDGAVTILAAERVAEALEAAEREIARMPVPTRPGLGRALTVLRARAAAVRAAAPQPTDRQEQDRG